MSAKGRGEKKDPFEYARTPPWATRAIVPRLGRPYRVLDLGCGDGSIGEALRSSLGFCEIVGVEIQEPLFEKARSCGAYSAVFCADMLAPDALATISAFDPSQDWYRAFDLVISNPPFSRAVEFLDVANRCLRAGGLISFLLRSNWVVPSCRRHLRHPDVPIPDLHFLERRPSFRTSARGNKTDSADYAWHQWRPSDPLHGGRFTVLQCEKATRTRTKKTKGAT